MTKKKAKQAPEEPRIYIVVPETVQILQKVGRVKELRTVHMEPGRLMAQCAHVARKLENEVIRQAWWQAEGGESIEDFAPYEEITTIVFSVRNVRALERVLEDLQQCAQTGDPAPEPLVFRDSNPEFYGTQDRVLTAVAVGPVERSKIAYAIDYLELYQ